VKISQIFTVCLTLNVDEMRMGNPPRYMSY
jgi:hypothetical protein